MQRDKLPESGVPDTGSPTGVPAPAKEPAHLLLVIVGEGTPGTGSTLPLFAASTAALREQLTILLVGNIGLTSSDRAKVHRAGWILTRVDRSGELRPGCVCVSVERPAVLSRARGSGSVKTAAARFPVDELLRLVAREYGEYAVVVLLSSGRGDGIRGLQAISEEGGIALALNVCKPARLADAAGLGAIDELLSLDELAHRARHHLSGVLAARRSREQDRSHGSPREPLRAVVVRHFGLDPADYRVELLTRRIQRRMRVRGVEQAAEYMCLLDQDGTESSRIVRDLLQRESRFFADSNDVLALERHVLPALLAQKTKGAAVRAWVPGCATGEEAYSLAILLSDGVEQANLDRDVRVFASDIDAAALTIARRGWYPLSIAEDVPNAKLERHFHEGDGVYRISKRIRDCMLFASHHLTIDPPFGQLDLISCHGVLTYLPPEERDRAFADFHSALSADGQLLLGSDAPISDSHGLFEPVEGVAGLFRRLEAQPHSAGRRWTIPQQPIAGDGFREVPPPPAVNSREQTPRRPQGAATDCARQRSGTMLRCEGLSLERLQTDNQELSCRNEELVATIRELELLREEQIGVSEQHITINQQLRTDLDALTRQHAHTLAAEDQANLAILVLDRELRIQRFTRGMLRLFKLHAADCGRLLTDILHPFAEEPWFADLKRTVAASLPSRRQLVACGRTYLLDVVPAATALGAGACVLKFEDVTELSEIEADLRRRLARHERGCHEATSTDEGVTALRERLGRARLFASNVAQELGAPLARLAQDAQSAIGLTQANGLEGRELLLQILDGAERCASVVDNAVRLACDELPLYRLAEFNRIPREAAAAVSRQIPSGKLTVAFALSTPDPWLRCNVSEIEEVFVTLLTNAALAHPAVCHVFIRSEFTAAELRVFVCDDGPGIAPSRLSHVFDPLSSLGRKIRRTGLNLSIAQRIIADHRGSISSRSAPGRGATFELHFPLER